MHNKNELDRTKPGKIGNVKQASLRELNQNHKQYLQEFFRTHGSGPCIVRHKDYGNFVKSLELMNTLSAEKDLKRQPFCAE